MLKGYINTMQKFTAKFISPVAENKNGEYCYIDYKPAAIVTILEIEEKEYKEAEIWVTMKKR